MTNDCNRFLLTVMQKAKLFPKPLIPVQFRVGAPFHSSPLIGGKPGVGHNDHFAGEKCRIVADAGATKTVSLPESPPSIFSHWPPHIPCGFTVAPPSMTSVLAATS